MPTTWNYTLLLPSGNEQDFGEERKKIEKKTQEFIGKYKHDRRYLEDVAVLKEALDAYNEWVSEYASDSKELYYYSLRNYIDQTDPQVKAALNKAMDFATKEDNDMNFFELSLAKIPAEQQKTFLAAPELSEYRHFLDRLFEHAKHLLTENEERIMSLKTRTAYTNWVEMVSTFLAKEEAEVLDETGQKVMKNFSEVISLIDNKDKAVRDEAAATLNTIFVKYLDVAEAEMNSVLQYRKVVDDIRGYQLPEESRVIGDNMDLDTVNALVKAVTDRFEIARRYYALKAKLLGYQTLAYHERNIPYGNITKQYTYEQGFQLVQQSLGALHPKFAEIMDMLSVQGSYDVYPKKGKWSGAFCDCMLKSTPTYILLNYSDKLYDVLTLAHETGHAINNELMREKQNGINFGVYTSTAEVASTFMEDFVLQALLKDADDGLRLALQMQKLNDDISTIFRQIGIYNFEKALHALFREKGYVTKEEIGDVFATHMAAYMGDTVEKSPGSSNWWIYISHIRTFFYVYSYASGLLISKSLQNKVKVNPAFIDEVIVFLSAGTSASPKEVFLNMGIDITSPSFWDQGLAEVDHLLTETEKLAAKLGKLTV